MTQNLNFYLSRMRDAGYKLTNARRTVLEVLYESHGHITSTDVLEEVNAVDDSIGRASVFRTLDLFTRLGIIRPTYIGSNMTPNYVMMHEGHHHHIICTNCNKTIEVHDCGLEDITAQLEAKFGVQLTGHLVEFYGICANCRANGET